jgi:hypothetical protein
MQAVRAAQSGSLANSSAKVKTRGSSRGLAVGPVVRQVGTVSIVEYITLAGGVSGYNVTIVQGNFVRRYDDVFKVIYATLIPTDGKRSTLLLKTLFLKSLEYQSIYVFMRASTVTVCDKVGKLVEDKEELAKKKYAPWANALRRRYDAELTAMQKAGKIKCHRYRRGCQSLKRPRE